MPKIVDLPSSFFVKATDKGFAVRVDVIPPNGAATPTREQFSEVAAQLHAAADELEARGAAYRSKE